jgi:hypothetical protein
MANPKGMLSAFTDGIDSWITAAGEIIVDDNASLDGETGLLGQSDCGPYTSRDDNHVAV